MVPVVLNQNESVTMVVHHTYKTVERERERERE
jgi:hypothetical protein